MAQIREIRNRIKAVGNIERITKTMQMIATAKFQATLKRAIEAKPYTTKLAKMVGELAAAAGGSAGDHPLLANNNSGKELVVVLTSNRGLCGGYNANVLRLAQQHVRTSDKQVDIEVVGKKGIAFFKFIGLAPLNTYTEFTDKTAYDEIETLAADYIERFTGGEYDAIRVVYMEFISNARQTPQNIQLLPLEPPAAETGDEVGGLTSVYEFSPDPAQLLGELLPLSVKSRFFQCFNDSIVSEQIARMIAMKAATDNAGKIGKELKRSANRARQAMITTELNEIIGGAAALE
ncbi:MAG: ATP synthase F1 subunit gamma [Planctomycetota bacterium]|jgi:F-type H+-transporting ATPase subunit gamma